MVGMLTVLLNTSIAQVDRMDDEMERGLDNALKKVEKLEENVSEIKLKTRTTESELVALKKKRQEEIEAAKMARVELQSKAEKEALELNKTINDLKANVGSDSCKLRRKPISRRS